MLSLICVQQPNVCVLLDVGTRPGSKSIYHLWKAFDVNSNVAGACGEIAAYKGKNWSGLVNPLGLQQFFPVACYLTDGGDLSCGAEFRV